MAIGNLRQLGQTLAEQLDASQGGLLGSDDQQCYDVSVYYFELQLPPPKDPSQGTQSTFLIPLVLNPTGISLSEPFAMEATKTQGSGLYVERNGIIDRSLRIQGHTGWIQQLWRGQGGMLDRTKAVDRNYTRDLSASPAASMLSGQKHFQYLQDGIFRTYSQFSKDPTTSYATKLIFHDPREQEQWTVEPRAFTMSRDAQNPLLYKYDIDLLVVDKASGAGLAPIDKTVIDKIRQGIADVADAVNVGRAYLSQFNTVAFRIRSLASQAEAIIVSAGSLFTLAANFVQGVTDVIKTPFSVLISLAMALDDLTAAIEQARAAGASIPEYARQAAMRLKDSVHALGMHPEVFDNPNDAAIARLKAEQGYTDAVGQAAIAAAALQTANGDSSAAQIAANANTTALSPADLAYAASQQAYLTAQIPYTGSQPYQVKQGDTFASLAARFLGSANLWVYIAQANGLKPPFAQAQATMPLVQGLSTGALSSIVLGSTIQIPDFSVSPTVAQSAAVVGASPFAPISEQYLGRDLAIGQTPADYGSVRSEVDGALFDLLVDTEHGATDIRVASGADNLAQAILLRIGTEQGTDVLYPTLGLTSLITTNLPGVDTNTALYSVRQAVLQDPRIAQVSSLQAYPGQSFDSIVLEGVLQATGIANPVTLSVPLPT